MSHAAYLMMLLDVDANPPVMVSLGIYSSNVLTMAISPRRHEYALLLKIDGRDYQDAHDSMLKMLRSPWWSWTLKWLSPHDLYDPSAHKQIELTAEDCEDGNYEDEEDDGVLDPGDIGDFDDPLHD